MEIEIGYIKSMESINEMEDENAGTNSSEIKFMNKLAHKSKEIGKEIGKEKEAKGECGLN